ncbi:MAG TPA: hypothetical protein VK009_13905 [Chloroflexota bacterium]|nr:hypothetical protein [Chloroflexota bacterium]
MPKITPIMGPGCGNPELEHCPPSYHVELTAAEVNELIQDPRNAAMRMGLGSDIRAVHLNLPETTADGFTTIYCCTKCLSDSLC